jgi:hypothetical protein
VDEGNAFDLLAATPRFSPASMKFPFVWLVLVALPLPAVFSQSEAAPAAASPAAVPAKGDKESGRLGFSLLPKSFQKDPLLDFNVLTEMTTDGRRMTAPTEASPVYCVIEGTTMKQGGDMVAGIKPPSPEAVRRLVLRALNKRHFLEAADGGPKATIAVIYHWGTHESPALIDADMMTTNEDGSVSEPPPSGSADDLMPRLLGDVQKRKILIDRAALVGGTKFALELNASLNEEAAFRSANDGTARLGGAPIMDPNGPASPFQRFKNRDAQTARLVEESFGGLFFVIISAFDYDSVAASKPVLLWRTKMSVNSSGVSLVETIQPLITAGSDFIGRETDGGILIARRLNRKGTVTLGTEEVVEVVEETTEPAPAPAEKKK